MTVTQHPSPRAHNRNPHPLTVSRMGSRAFRRLVVAVATTLFVRLVGADATGELRLAFGALQAAVSASETGSTKCSIAIWDVANAGVKAFLREVRSSLREALIGHRSANADVHFALTTTQDGAPPGTVDLAIGAVSLQLLLTLNTQLSEMLAPSAALHSPQAERGQTLTMERRTPSFCPTTRSPAPPGTHSRSLRRASSSPARASASCARRRRRRSPRPPL